MKQWPADVVERRDISTLIPYAKNSRTHSDAQVAQIAASMKEWGWTNPILIDSAGSVIAGHGRLLAARQLGYTEAPVMVAEGWTEAQTRAYVIADNKLALNAGWDDVMLGLELAELKDIGFDTDLTGFSLDEIAMLNPEATEGLTDEDAVPDAPIEPVTKLGDVWIMGNHRLMCGDSTSIDAVDKLMARQKADFCFTSPPYNAALGCSQIHSKAPPIQGVSRGHKSDRFNGNGLYGDGYTDARTPAEYVQFNADIINTLSSVAASNFTCCYNINYNKNSPSEYIDVVHAIKQSIPLVETIVWEKAMAVSLQGDNLTRIYEFVFVLCAGKFKINKNRTECLKNLWKISNIGANHETHKACFPIKLVEEGIKNFAPHGAVIIEPFGGTGTTVIAAEKLGCKAHLMELDPKYCDVIVKRWQDFTGKQATLESDGSNFPSIKQDHVLQAA